MDLRTIRAMHTWLAARAGRRLGHRGASMVEYILLVSLIAIVVLVAVQFFGSATSEKYSGTTSSLYAD